MICKRKIRIYQNFIENLLFICFEKHTFVKYYKNLKN